MTPSLPTYLESCFLDSNGQRSALPREPTEDEASLNKLNVLLAKRPAQLMLPDYASYEKCWKFDVAQPKLHRGRDQLYRQFKLDEESGGRVSGHWVQSCPKVLRPYVTFKGEPTCEYDYKAAQVSFAYSLVESPFPDASPNYDPYVLPGYDETSRELFKWAFTTGIGIGKDVDPNSAFAKALLDAGLQPKVGQADELREAFWSHHHAIKSFLQTQAWRKLQKAESDVSLKVIREMGNKNIPLIPIYDSFICPASHSEALMLAMSSATKDLSAPPTPRRVF